MAVQSKNNDKIDNRLYKEKINYYLNKRKWSIFELSQQADISAATIYEWYHNKKRPSLTNITKICEAFNITLAQFFSGTSGEHVAANLSELLKLCKDLNYEEVDAILQIVKHINK